MRLSRGIEKTESIYAAEGTRAHEIAATKLRNMGGYHYPEDLSQDDLDAIETYVNFVWPLSSDNLFMIERRFDLTEFYPELYGTADAVVYNYALQKLVVVDYKHGAGIPVEVENNSQLKYYGLGAVHALGLPIKSVELVIVQPRCFHKDGPIRKWATTAQDLFEFLGDLISDADATKKEDAPLHVGEHCRFCPAQSSVCPAVREKSLEMARQVFSPTQSYSPEALGKTLKMLPTMEAWIAGVRSFAYQEAQAGRTPPGWKVVAKRPTRKWKEGWTGERIAQEFGLKPPEAFTNEVKSVAQIEKIIEKKFYPALDLIVDKISSGNTLVPEEDARPSVGGDVRDVFTVIEQ